MIPGLVFVFTLSFGQERRADDRWFAVDKTKHFVTAAFVQSVSFSALRTTGLSRGQSLAGATVVAGAVSIGKEISDARSRGRVSQKDLVWDAAGMAAASLLLHRTER